MATRGKKALYVGASLLLTLIAGLVVIIEQSRVSPNAIRRLGNTF